MLNIGRSRYQKFNDHNNRNYLHWATKTVNNFAYDYWNTDGNITQEEVERIVVNITHLPYEIYILVVYGIVITSNIQWLFLRCCDNVSDINKTRLPDLVQDIRVAFTILYKGETEDFEQDLLLHLMETIKSYKFDRDKPSLFRGYMIQAYPRRVAALLFNNRRRNRTSISKAEGKLFPARYIEHKDQECQTDTEELYQMLQMKYTK